MSKRLLYIAPHRPERSPGQRYRFEQYIDYLTQNNFEITYSFVVNKWDDSILYRKGRYLFKLWIGVKAFLIRMNDWMRVNKFDVVLVYREAQFLGNTFFEKRFAKSKAKLVFDFDDAIWLNDTSDGNRNLKWLKNPEKINDIISLSDLTIVGNNYLADYAKIFSDRVIVIPTTIDTARYKSLINNNSNKVCIGWTGSKTTLKHFQDALPFLKEIKEKYNGRVVFKVIVDTDYKVPELGLVSTAWNKDSEVKDLDEIDIGIMPLPNDKWSKGKCGFKGIQYMSMEKPTVMSPVGVNVNIIEHGKNGYLASSKQEWVDILSELIESPGLRKKIGKAGRITIEKSYSVDSQKKSLLISISKLLN